MSHNMRPLLRAGFVAAVVVLASVSVASAQPNWSGCSNTTIVNQTNCTIELTLVTTPPAGIPTVSITAGKSTFIPTPFVTTIDAVTSSGGNDYPVTTPIPPNTCTGSWGVCGVTLPPNDCCVDVCFDPSTCTITINSANYPMATECRP